jgi:transposase-like protein
LTEVNTAPGDWKQADIRWVEEERTVLRPVNCPKCHGDRHVYTLQGGTEIVEMPAHFYDRQDKIRNEKLVRRACHKCVATRGRYQGYATGKVLGEVKAMVMVGYPVWPAGVAFDSRFRRTETQRYCCELCSKSLMSFQVPAVGKSADGRSHGMWVGTDCAKKFLPGVHIYPPADAKKKGLDIVMDEAAA